jgi:hypothetical protein
MNLRFRRLIYLPVILLYVGYIFFITKANQSGVDFETFMSIGERFRAGQSIWIENSYYPMPYVMIFGLLSALPRPVSILVWHTLPVLAALAIARWKPSILLFAPLFAHTIGGQTALFGMVGLYLYQRNQTRWQGGVGLGILLIKPQLALFPLLWAGWKWLRDIREKPYARSQIAAFGLTGLLIYLPGFLIIPDWVTQWLNQARPLKSRAMAGILPRSLYMIMGQSNLVFWIILAIAGLAALLVIIRLIRGPLSFEGFMLWSYLVNPLVHDYDLIQMIPIFETLNLRWTAILASIPTWIVIFFAYGNDEAWYVVTFIPLIILIVWIWKTGSKRQTVNIQMPDVEPAQA